MSFLRSTSKALSSAATSCNSSRRGNRRHAENAVIRFQLSVLLDTLSSERASAIKPSAINRYDLGHVDGIPFCFTDAAALQDGAMVFTAIAEDTDDAYNDGPCAAAAIGIADNNGHLRCLRRLDRPHKVEGVDARVDGDVIRLLLMTDADDAEGCSGRPLSATIGR